MYPVIRLERIELKDFKNVKQGTIESSEYRNKLFFTNKADVIGIYGQNGSGKTAVVEALNLLKLLMGGEALNPESVNLVNQEAQEAVLKYVFYIEEEGSQEQAASRYLIYYDVVLAVEEEKTAQEVKHLYLKTEILSYSTIGVRSKTELIHYDYDNAEFVLLPKVRYTELTRQNADAQVSLEVAKRMSLKEGYSFIFQEEVVQLFLQTDMNQEHGRILSLLHYYAKMNLFIIANRNIADYGIRYMPISFRLTLEDIVTSGIAPISLTGPTTIQSSAYGLVQLVIEQLNFVIGSILPGMQIDLQDLGNELSLHGEEAKRVELVSVRDGIKVPLKYESEGIKKILSILSTLVSVYNNPSICLVVDELDSGIFEYLLGELLEILERHAKGQLIFTSHNLRALEKLHRESIVISTANPMNRFVRIPHDKSHKNIRNSYLRSIDLGGIDEEIYRSTNSYEISYAFQKAGELFERN